MMAGFDFFSINTIAFTLWNHPISWIELLGTIFGLWSVWLAARENILTWPIGIVNIFFFFLVFYQVQLYSDMTEQVYYLVTTVYGWVLWSTAKHVQGRRKVKEIPITILSRNHRIMLIVGGVIAVTGLTVFMMNIHLILPVLFPDPAAFPFWDALSTVGSFIAQFIMARKKLETFPIWIGVDVINIILFFFQGIYFIAVEYVLFLVLAIMGFSRWRKGYRESLQGGVKV
jgi:nicotinamide mononucleotide transporter